MEILLHSGLDHPNTLWIAVAAVVAFALGVGVGAFRPRIESAIRDATEE
ncbi:hypothetical protein U4E84_13265 [Halorubrum sp. AD140]|nr:hypothetical protein [Halorubrum sp. AD140]MDZ5812312.1 hypothetical protein [Halorubrum sp. AD140]